MSETLTSPGGRAVDYYGPSAAAVRRALDRGHHTKAAFPRKQGAIPTVGYVVRKPRDVAYVEVSATMRGLTTHYRRTLESAGYIVEDNRWRSGELIVFAEPGKGSRPRAK